MNEETTHPRGFLKVSSCSHAAADLQLAATGRWIATIPRFPDSQAVAERLVACWNACEGIPTNELMPGEPPLEEADVWHEGSRSFYRARLLKKLTPEEALLGPSEPALPSGPEMGEELARLCGNVETAYRTDDGSCYQRVNVIVERLGHMVRKMMSDYTNLKENPVSEYRKPATAVSVVARWKGLEVTGYEEPHRLSLRETTPVYAFDLGAKTMAVVRHTENSGSITHLFGYVYVDSEEGPCFALAASVEQHTEDVWELDYVSVVRSDIDDDLHEIIMFPKLTDHLKIILTLRQASVIRVAVALVLDDVRGSYPPVQQSKTISRVTRTKT